MAQGTRNEVHRIIALGLEPCAFRLLAITPRFDSTGDFEEQRTALKSCTDLIFEFKLDVIAKFSGPDLIFRVADAGSYLLGKMFPP